MARRETLAEVPGVKGAQLERVVRLVVRVPPSAAETESSNRMRNVTKRHLIVTGARFWPLKSMGAAYTRAVSRPVVSTSFNSPLRQIWTCGSRQSVKKTGAGTIRSFD